eukprot:scaffold71641_cov36-Tisochrysis_lutea.AAC.3
MPPGTQYTECLKGAEVKCNHLKHGFCRSTRVMLRNKDRPTRAATDANELIEATKGRDDASAALGCAC